MSGHFILKCKKCGAVMAQCRCPASNKEVRYGVCVKCGMKGRKAK